MFAPERVSLSPSALDYVSDAISRSLRTLGAWAKVHIRAGRGQEASTTLSPAGSPLPWQAAVPAAPFTLVNLATGNLLTGVPLVSWRPLGRPISFSLFHNTLGDEPGQATLGDKWTHSYSRHLAYDEIEDEYTLYTDEGGSVLFTSLGLNAYAPPVGFHMTLVRYALLGEIHLTYKNQELDVFDLSDGLLTEVTDASGNTHTLSYVDVGGQSCLSQIQDASENLLTLTYDEETDLLVEVGAPAIGPPDNSFDRDYAIDCTNPALMRISTARRDETQKEPFPPLFWAEFSTSDNKLTSILDRLGTQTDIDYDGNDRLETVTRDEGGLGLVFDYTFTLYDVPGGCGEGCFPVVSSAKVRGVRTPVRDVTTYAFDTTGRLTSVVDPLLRPVTTITWDQYNNAATITNVLGGVTTRSSDQWGNLEYLETPTGEEWWFEYDGLNNLTEITDPEDSVTTLSYSVLGPNPTRPTSIDGPGVSDLSLEWGEGAERDGPPYDMGKLTRTVSPNGIEQISRYGNGLPGPVIRNGIGQLTETTHGRGDFCGDEHPVQDNFHQTDTTGDVDSTTEGMKLCLVADDDEPCPDCPGCIIRDCQDCIDPQEDHYQCPAGDSCEVEYDADGNSSPCFGCTGGERGTISVEFNGNGQPLLLPQLEHLWGSEYPSFGSYGYTFEYDALGRKTDEAATCGSPECDDDGPQIQPHVMVNFVHTVTWSYNDQAGEITREYSPEDDPNHPQPGEADIDTVTETDLAGRATSITQGAVPTQYAYADSVILPAVVETKPDGTRSDYYLDVSGRVRKIVHKDDRGREVLGLVYTRDAKGRVASVVEVVNMAIIATTAYTYGDGHLDVADLDEDSGEEIEPEKLYYSWFLGLAGANYFRYGGDPNRLVKEVRTGASPYHHEYWYDAGGNRLAMRKMVDQSQDDAPDYQPVEIIRYNYAYLPDYDGADPRLGTGEPDPEGSLDEPWSYNAYTSGTMGQDKLLGTTTYLFDGQGEPIPDQPPVYSIYEYKTSAGSMSRKMSWDGQTDTQLDTQYTYERSRLQSVVVDEITWPDDPEEDPDMDLDRERFLEVYAYDIFGQRIGVMHCTELTTGAYVHPGYAIATNCKASTRIYDYVDGRLLVERETRGANRLVSVYTWGPMGLVARRGVSVRNGSWDPDGGDACDPPPGMSGEFVPTEWNALRNYTYMSDHMGNVAALVDSTSDVARRQVFDAFGNQIDGYVTFQCASDHDFTDLAVDPVDPPCPLPAAQPIERMQAGGLNWRGGEGSITDRVAEDMQDTETFDLRWSAYERPSTGLIYMQARYYEPETGRFTQADPLPYGLETVLAGQNNRWVYCANDPVNCTDPSGLFPFVLLAVVVLVGALLGGLTNSAAGGSFWAGAAGGALAGGLSLLGPWGAAGGSGLGAGLTSALNGNAFDQVMIDMAVGTVAGLLGIIASGLDLDWLINYLIAIDATMVTNCISGLRGILG